MELFVAIDKKLEPVTNRHKELHLKGYRGFRSRLGHQIINRVATPKVQTKIALKYIVQMPQKK